ncbi:MAG TPA: hypothetical protein PKW07_04010 [Syntrophorhabdaceae bacterium]|nr:hypothetical protein [Syntrophorhabdaceae bacterium]
MEDKLICEKYKQLVDIKDNSCPHPDDYCQFRTRCIINYRYREAMEKKEKRRRKIEDT